MKLSDYDEFEIGDDRLLVTKSYPDQQASDELVPPTAEINKFLIANGLIPDKVYVASTAGAASAGYLDDGPASDLHQAGYQVVNEVDALFGPVEIAKGCWLGDCGFLLVSGTSASGQPFNGFVHTTRLNMNGDDQFESEDGSPCGGVELILRRMLAHYQPRDLKLVLAAGIAPQFYVHEFEPGQAGEQKIAEGFRGWQENGWIKPHKIDGRWDGKSYEADLYAAVRHQVERAGLLESYVDEHIKLIGDPTSGHASHRAAARGLLNETRDLYLLMPR